MTDIFTPAKTLTCKSNQTGNTEYPMDTLSQDDQQLFIKLQPCLDQLKKEPGQDVVDRILAFSKSY
ncbi:hypothetical protein GS399_07420 [Pedobacter sp. HMF7647]|uniref:Uncharacterized protein n=1 Tax=Hufsiella arboris TaxID=2695275 RepID=A0A7K1Y9L0_9SPHI|nr:hypothetical protein [Hufsiella arboris]MXV50799.1 hypothetical protein [Hufsiella arboris]